MTLFSKDSARGLLEYVWYVANLIENSPTTSGGGKNS
jgi:hypothetical protein